MEYISAVLILAIIIFICSCIDQKRREKARKIQIENERSGLSENSEEIRKYIEKYKKQNRNWNVCPKLNTIPIIYAIAYVYFEDSDRAVKKFVTLSRLSVSGNSIKALYVHNRPGGMFHGPKSELHELSFSKEDFNKTWFVSEEIAREAVLNCIESGDKNINYYAEKISY